MTRTNAVFLSVLGFVLVFAQMTGAQSLHVQNPAPLSPGPNQASVDSFVGPQFWSFVAQPGRFRLLFSGGGTQEGFSVGGRAVAGIAFAPSARTSRYTVRETPQGTVFEGTVEHPQKVVIEVDPAKSPLVRQTTDYTLTLSGSVDAGTAPPAQNAQNGTQIVGVYVSKISDAGAVRFEPDGMVVASNGARGSWVLFDAGARIYTVYLGGARYTVTLSPGRGLVDSGNHNLIFELQR